MFFDFKNIKVHIKREIVVNELIHRSIFSDEPIINENSSNDKFIVSLTTYSKRLEQVHLVIESLSLQSVKADKVILWLDHDEFSIEDLPKTLINQMNRGLEIRFCENYRSYKKLIPTLLLYPDSNIITIDDDLIYPYYFIDKFIREHNKSNNVVLSYRAHKIALDKNGIILPYLNWNHSCNDFTASDFIFPTGVGGVLYPIGSLHPDVTNYQMANRLAPSADDIWFKAMCIKQGTKSKLILNSEKYNEDFINIDDGEDIALSHINVLGGENDNQMSNVVNEFELFLSDDLD